MIQKAASKTTPLVEKEGKTVTDYEYLFSMNLQAKLKEKIQELQHPTAGGVTASFGITEYLEDESIETLFKRCDKALYLAKENGRNRVEIL